MIFGSPVSRRTGNCLELVKVMWHGPQAPHRAQAADSKLFGGAGAGQVVCPMRVATIHVVEPVLVGELPAG